MQDIKLLIPFVTFFLGLIAAPYIEKIKEDSKAKSVLKNFRLELQDEMDLLPNKIRMLLTTLRQLQSLKRQKKEIFGPMKFIPREISCYFLKDAIEKSFRLLDKNQRFAIKSLKVQINALTEYGESLKPIEADTDEFEELLNIYKRFIYTGCCTHFTMGVIVGSKQKNDDTTDDIMLANFMDEHNIEMEPSELNIKGKVTIKANKQFNTEA